MIKAVRTSKYTTAIDKLQKATLTKTDRCAKAGRPDKNDLVTNCPAQARVYSEVNHIIQEVQALQGL